MRRVVYSIHAFNRIYLHMQKYIYTGRHYIRVCAKVYILYTRPTYIACTKVYILLDNARYNIIHDNLYTLNTYLPKYSSLHKA